MTDTNAVVAVYDSHAAAENAVEQLQKSGFDMEKLSIVGKDYLTEEHVTGYYNTDSRMKHWGKLGAFWGGLWGLLLGAAFFWVPGVGAVLVGGPLVASIVGALEAAVVVGGVSAIGAGLVSLGIPKNSVVTYETEVKAGKYLVIAHGTADDAAKAKNILNSSNPDGVTDHILIPA
ncbi:general stress protein [Silvibacterium dinghuense]|uniref:Permease n=1 Tax=Silvibacterium dinghuense TaxID=1560006 RepID=A0A4Q1S7C7_9BACT|nr:general stress protein [Silvibacterium dinghuense]RXS92782.1 permease [Silvibacterium dinghuense]GGH17647.1 membrane protein [Silvibacterium dinghuense]